MSAEGPARPGPDLESMSYEQLVELLEQLARRMSSGEVGIEEAAELYEQAQAVHKAARQRLDRVARRIAELAGEGPQPG
ncbi:MAG TPA: exodeoxyribonuclease VII small subunit [Acidimicrobiales bacterium]|nr:exodeoxyribonuclease VII small subunit [Acidimicrobiales bacterium]